MEGFLKWATGGTAFLASTAYAIDYAPETMEFLGNTIYAGIEDEGIATFAEVLTTFFGDILFVGAVTAAVTGATGWAANKAGIY